MFLADPDTQTILRDRSIIGTLSFKAELYGPLIPKAEAISNSDNWIFEPAKSDDDNDPPESQEAFPVKNGEPSVSKPNESAEPPATVSGSKRKSR